MRLLLTCWKEWHKLHFDLSIPFFSLSKLHLLSFSGSAINLYVDIRKKPSESFFLYKKRLLSGFSLIAVLTFSDVCLLQKFKELKSLHIFCIDCSKFVVSSKFLVFYTPQNPGKTGVIESFIYLSSSLWGTVIRL